MPLLASIYMHPSGVTLSHSWNVGKLDSNVFGAFERGHEVEVGYVHCHEACILGGDDIVE